MLAQKAFLLTNVKQNSTIKSLIYDMVLKNLIIEGLWSPFSRRHCNDVFCRRRFPLDLKVLQFQIVGIGIGISIDYRLCKEKDGFNNKCGVGPGELDFARISCIFLMTERYRRRGGTESRFGCETTHPIIGWAVNVPSQQPKARSPGSAVSSPPT